MSDHNTAPGDPGLVEIVDLEQYAQQGKKPPISKAYKLRVDEKHFIVNTPTITGREVLALVCGDPATQYVTMRVRGGHPPLREIGLDEQVDLTTPGIERFFTRSRHSQPG